MNQPHDHPAPDMIRIDPEREWEVRYWAELFGVTDDEIHAAIREVGVMTADVRRYFNAW